MQTNLYRKQISSCLATEDQREAWERRTEKGYKEISGDDGYLHYLNCGDGFTGVFICQNLSNSTL